MKTDKVALENDENMMRDILFGLSQNDEIRRKIDLPNGILREKYKKIIQ